MTDQIVPRDLRGFVKRIERRKATIGKHRDALRDIQDGLEAFLESSDDAIESLDQAIERLSEHL